MSDEKNKVTHEIYADASQANAALQQHTEEWKKLSQQIQLSINMFRQFYQTAGSNLSWDHANKAFAKGSFTGQVNDTAVRALINNVRNEFDAAVRRLQKAMHDEQVKAIKQTQERFAAQLEMERRRSDPSRINAGLRIDAANNSPSRLSERVLTAEMRAKDHVVMARLEMAERKFSAEFLKFRNEMDKLRNSQARLEERLHIENRRSAPHMIRERMLMADRQFSEGRSNYRLQMDSLRYDPNRMDYNVRRETLNTRPDVLEHRIAMLERRLSDARLRYQEEMDRLRYDPNRLNANLSRERILNRPEVLQERVDMLERRSSADRIAYRREMDALKFDPRRMNERLGDEQRLTQYGAAGSSNLRTWDRLNNNGGADMMAIQARLMGNYQVIAGAFNSARWMGRFMVDLDKEFRQLQAIAGMTYTEMDKLEGSLIKVSEATKFTAVEVAQASVLLAQAGLSGREVSETIDSVALLATAAGTDLSQAVDVATSTLSIFNLQTAEMPNVANVLTAALNKSKLTIDKLALGFQYAGNIAAQSGMTFTEVTSVLGALANSGIRSGSTLGTGFRQLLVDLQKPSEKFAEILKSLNLTLDDVDVKSKGFTNVINTLAEAGFTASDAFQTFEVRAAAAYSALANNVGLANSLQRELLMTTAASEANAVQMESLANTWKQFQSVVGSAAYQAFKPVMAMLQDFLRLLTQMISKLTESEEALRMVGIAITAIATGSAVTMLSRLVSGFATLAGALRTTATAGAGLASVGGVLAGLVRFAGPLGLLVGTISGVAAAFYALGESRPNLDRIKASINDLDGELSATEQKMTAIQQTVDNLRQQQEALDANPDARITKILEVKQAFTQLSTEIDTSTASVEDLIQALLGLKAEFADLLPGTLNLMGAELRSQIDELTKQRNEAVSSGTGQSQLAEALRLSMGDDAFRSYKRGVRGSGLQGMDAILPGLRDQFGEQGARVGEILGGGEEAFEFELKYLSDHFKAELKDAERERNETLVQALQSIIEAIETQLPVISQLEAAKFQLETHYKKAGVTHARSVVEGMDLVKIGDELFSDLNKELDNALYGQDVDKHAEIGEKVLQSFQERITAYNEMIDTAAQRVRELVPELSAEQVGVIIGDTHAGQRQSGIRRTSTAVRSGTYDATVYQRLQKAEEDIVLRDQETQRLVQESKTTNSQVALEGIRQRLIKLGEQELELIKQRFGLNHAGDSKYYDSDDEITGFGRQKLDEELRKAREEQTKLLGDVASQVERVEKEGQKRALDEMKSQYKDLENEFKRLEDGLRRLPISELQAAIRQLEGVGQQMRAKSAEIANFEAGMYSPSAYGASASPQASDIQRKIIEAAKAAGIDPLAALALVSSESNFKPFIKAPGSSAFGLFQIVKDTFQDLHGGEGTQAQRVSIDQQIADGIELMRRVEADPEIFAMLGGRKPTIQEHKIAHMANIGGFKKMLRNPNDPIPDSWATANGVPIGTTNQEFIRTFAGKKLTQHIEAVKPLLTHIDGNVPQEVSSDQTDRDTTVEINENQARDYANRRMVRADVERINKTEAPVIMNNIETMMTQIRRFTDPSRVEAQIPELEKQFDELVRLENEKYEKQLQTTQDREALDEQHQDLLAKVESERAQRMLELVRARDAAVERAAQTPVKEAEAKIEGARRHGAPDFQIRELEGAKILAEEAAQAQTLVGYKETLVQIQNELNEAQKGTPQYLMWLQQEKEQLDKIAEAQGKVNALKAAPEQKQAIDYIRDANQEFLAQQGLLKQTQYGTYKLASAAEQAGQYQMTFAQGLSGAFKGLFTDLITGSKTAAEALRDFAMNLANVFAEIASTILTNQIMQALLGQQGQGGFLSNLFGGGGGLFGGLLSGGGGVGGVPLPIPKPILPIPVMHGGGIVGQPYARRSLSLAAFRGAPRFHEGGIVGADERPIVAKLGEEVLTPQDWRHRRNLQTSDPFARGSSRRSMEVSRTERARRQPDRNVNVWVVSPDQVPPPGPNDIIHTIADNINRGGVVKQLVKKVVMNG